MMIVVFVSVVVLFLIFRMSGFWFWVFIICGLCVMLIFGLISFDEKIIRDNWYYGWNKIFIYILFNNILIYYVLDLYWLNNINLLFVCWKIFYFF